MKEKREKWKETAKVGLQRSEIERRGGETGASGRGLLPGCQDNKDLTRY